MSEEEAVSYVRSLGRCGALGFPVENEDGTWRVEMVA